MKPKQISIDKKLYQVNANEFNPKFIQEFCNLKMFEEIGEQERLIGLLNNLSTDLSIKSLFCLNPTHGGFIPIQCSNIFNKVDIFTLNEKQLENIVHNIKHQNIKNINTNFIQYNEIDSDYIIFINKYNFDKYQSLSYLRNTKNIILTDIELKDIFNLQEFKVYILSKTEYKLYIPNELNEKFLQYFYYYLNKEDSTLFEYDNLINLCIMVKNGGPQFAEMLKDNKHLIDRWTILDTGSTDNTIQTIKEVLSDKKGQLFEEEFINFRDSRNHLLDYAGNMCKYKLMLDDTYVVKGDLRKFLNDTRGDQYSDSFTLYIQSDDVKYGSNRITKSYTNLRYKHRIHEVINDKDNINVVIPETCSYIDDRRFDYMEERTTNRKQLDLKLLFEEVEENPNDPRAYYYLAQTYNCIGDYENAYKYFLKRAEFRNSGFQQELIDAVFEAARIANFKLNKPWEECLKLYELAYKLDESRPDAIYFIGIHHYLEGNESTAFYYMKKAFDIGFPVHCQYSLKPTLSYLYVPKFLAKLCYNLDEYELGLKACTLYLQNNKPGAEAYDEMVSWYQIYLRLNEYKGHRNPKIPEKPIFCYVAPGGFNKWSGKNILTSGVGGSETYIIEMARYIKQHNYFDVYVFCDCEEPEVFEGVNYRHLNEYPEFINTNYVHTVIVSRFSEYLPVTFKGWSENVYLVVHDLSPSGIVIPKHSKLKYIFTLTEWHANYLSNIFPDLKEQIVPFYYGIDFEKFNRPHITKQPYSFIYSSFANRGLLPLLQMWPRINQCQPQASLHIYCDLENKWLNDFHKEQVIIIKQLFEQYNVKENGMNIYYHGWVDKKTLADAWCAADFWFYPCIFLETFCLTALEAAITKTFVITNGVGSLENTVAERGLVIPGEPMSQEWQNETFNKLQPYLLGKNNLIKKGLIEENYMWALSLSWKNQACKLLNEYILQQPFEYKNMFNWTNDLPFGHKKYFLDVIDYFNTNYKLSSNEKRPIKVLEIGTYTGMSLIEIVKLIPNSVGYGVDKWESYDENKDLEHMYDLQVEQSFKKNIEKAGLKHRITGIKGDSYEVLLNMVKQGDRFDFIYVDGSHKLLDCYGDLLLSWELLNKNGILAIDDCLFKLDEANVDKNKVFDTVLEAVNHFGKKFVNKYKVLHSSYRVFLQKIH